LFVDASGRLGVGESTPSNYDAGGNKLVIADTTNSGITIRGGTSGQGAIYFADGTTGNEAFRGRIEYSHSSDSLNFGTAGTGSKVTLDSSGRLGVGSSSPEETVDVNGAITWRGSLNTGKTSAGALDRSGNELRIRAYGATAGTGQLVFRTGGGGGSVDSEAMRIDSSQRVGIGNTASGFSSNLIVGSGTGDNGTTIYAGTASSAYLHFADGTTGQDRYRGGIAYNHANNSFSFATNDTTALTIDSSQRVGIGTTSPLNNLHVEGASPIFRITDATTGNLSWLGTDATGTFLRTFGGDSFRVVRGSGSESFRSDSSGRLLVGTSSSTNAPANCKLVVDISGASSRLEGANGYGLDIVSPAVPPSGYDLGVLGFKAYTTGTTEAYGAFIVGKTDGAWSSGSAPTRLVFSTTASGSASPTERMRISNNGNPSFFDSAGNGVTSRSSAGATTSENTFAGFYSATSTANGTASFVVRNNGNVLNTNNSYGSLSDIKLKENIVDANSQWSDLKALQVRNYNLKESQTHTQIGLVAQEVELVSPGLVNESPDRDEDGNDLGTVTKSVNYSVLYMKAVKALQEAMERIEQLETSNADLLARVTALEGA
jgi:hypothetical protein